MRLSRNQCVHVVTWKPLAEGSYTTKVDGSVLANMRAAFGGLIRNHNGDLTCAIWRNLGCCSTLEVELWGILYGLEMAMLITDLNCGSSASLKKPWDITMKHNFRQGNRNADFVAKEAHEQITDQGPDCS